MSIEYEELKADILALKEGLMSFEKREDGDYTAEEILKCKAFIVFSHAEVENYFEKVSRRIMSEARQRWESNAVPDRVIATLLAYRRKELSPIPENPKQSSRKSRLESIVAECFKLHEAAIADNNGIKATNLSQLLSPIGLMPHDIEEAMIIQLDKTGAVRGDLVHKQSKVSMRRIRDPFSDELSDISNLIDELERFDTTIESIGLLSKTGLDTGVLETL